MIRPYFIMIALLVATASVVPAASVASADEPAAGEEALLNELSRPADSILEELLQKSSLYESVEGIASYYARRFEWRRTTSGQLYNPDKLTAAHQSLAFGTVVRVLNPATRQEVLVTVNDRCASKSFHFIDLSRAAAKRIGLWGKGKIRVVIIPLLEDKLEEPA
jgi:rare lipoprotein A